MKRPEITERDARAAFLGALRKAPRLGVTPVQWAGVGVDGRGRLLQYVAAEVGPDEWLVFHAMRVTKKIIDEIGLRR